LIFIPCSLLNVHTLPLFLSIISMSSSSQTRASGGGTICHILPCSIDEDITAPVAQYFHPTPLTTTHNNPADGDSKDSSTSDVTIMAAQFRGRGLLCATDAKHESSSNDIATGKVYVDLTNQGQSTADGEAANTDDPSSTSLSPLKQSYKRPLSKLPPTMAGVVFNHTQTSTNNQHKNHNNNNNNNKDPPMQPLTTIETFSHIYNWRHEHDDTKVLRESTFGSSDKEGLNAVLGWCDVAHAVHFAVPLPQK